MKKNVLIVSLLIFITCLLRLNAQSLELSIENQNASNGKDYFCEIKLRAATGTVYLAGGDIAFSFNYGNFTTPEISIDPSLEYWTLNNSGGDNITSLGGSINAYYKSLVSPTITNNQIILNINSPSFANQTDFNSNVAVITETPVSFGRYKISGISNPAGTMGLKWQSNGSGIVITRVFTYTNVSPWKMNPVDLDLVTIPDILLPVELLSFSASLKENNVLLNWKTATEVNNYGFEIERKSSDLSNSEWAKIGFIPGNGNSNSTKEYSFVDNDLSFCGKRHYRIKQIDKNGKFTLYDAITVLVDAPKEYKLMQNSPNPFNPTTSIKYQLPVSSYVSVRVFDLLGREVATLVNEEKPAGYHIVFWEGKDNNGLNISSGIYVYVIKAGDFMEIKKMNFIK